MRGRVQGPQEGRPLRGGAERGDLLPPHPCLRPLCPVKQEWGVGTDGNPPPPGSSSPFQRALGYCSAFVKTEIE